MWDRSTLSNELSKMQKDGLMKVDRNCFELDYACDEAGNQNDEMRADHAAINKEARLCQRRQSRACQMAYGCGLIG